MWKSVVSWSAGCLSVVGIICWIIFYYRAEYLALFLALFLSVLGVMHLLLVNGKLTVHSVRVMDGLYVLTGCIAAGLAAYSSHDRDPYLDAAARWTLAVRIAFSRVEPDPNKLADFIQNERAFFCDPAKMESDKGKIIYTKDFCDWTEQLAQNLRKLPSDPDLLVLTNDTATDVRRNGWQSQLSCDPPRKITEPSALPELEPPIMAETRMYLCIQASFTSHILSTLDLMTDIRAMQRPRPPPSPETTSFGLLRTVLWPLLLALAFALRLTKATSDITGWAIP